MDRAERIEVDSDKYKHRLLAELSNHVGEVNAISMPALYQAVFDRSWSNRINDTRPLRKLITIMRENGTAICSVSSSAFSVGGYYIPAAGSELADYLKRDKIKALRILRRDAKIMQISLRNFLRQLALESEGNDEAA